MSLSPAFLDELRARVSLSGVIGRTTRLIKAGHEFKACCPFHDEKSPSFTVNDDKGFYHCFGCGAHGDAIRWLTDQRGLGFMDAVKELALEAGMELPAPDPRAAQAAEKRDSLHDVMRAAQDWFVANLGSDRGAAARSYLTGRGIDADTAARFGFGLALDDRNGLKSALSRFPEAMLVEAGLLIEVEGRETYDRFRSRLMLPIEDMRGRVIAFGGRILDTVKTDAPKYLNSPDTPLFDKGATLYNLNRAAAIARKSGRLIVVEGYMDVIALAAAGITECVAPMGTALTERQLELLWRQVETPVLCFDGDAAGTRAAMRAATRALPMLKPAHSLRIVVLPENQDPDDVVRKTGALGFEQQLDTAFTLNEYIWLTERNNSDSTTPEGKSGLKDRLRQHIETISDPVIKSLYKQDFFAAFFSFAYERRKQLSAPTSGESTDPRFARLKQLYAGSVEQSAKLMHERLGAALARGFLLMPQQLEKYHEALVHVQNLDGRIDVMLDGLRHHTVLTREYLRNILFEHSVQEPRSVEWDDIAFPFTLAIVDPQRAYESMGKALIIYSELARAREHLAAAQRRHELLMDKNSEDEKTRLLTIVMRMNVDASDFAARHVMPTGPIDAAHA